MESFDLYTADRERTGRTMLRGEKTPDGLYRAVIHVCIFSPDGKLLIQQRQSFKKGWPGLWDVSVGGHVSAGESPREAAERETEEELGLDISLGDVRPVLTLHWDKGFDDYYVLTLPADIGALRLQYDEVQAAAWADLDTVLGMIDEGRFIPYEKSLIAFLFTRRTNRDAHSRPDTGKG